MSAAGEVAEQGRCGCPDLGVDLLGVGSVGHVVRVVDVGGESLNWEGVGWIPPQGGPQAHGEATLAR